MDDNYKGDLISRQAVDRLVWQYLRSGTDENIAFYEHFLDLPSADVRENIHGHWEDEEDIFARCSKCGLRIFLCQRWFKCCPRCMAVMDGEPKGEKGTE